MGLFFKQRGHYVFDYKPIFYDPRKEDRLKRLNAIKKELGIEEDETEQKDYKPSFNFRRTSISRARRNSASNIRLIVIMIMLAVMAYFFFFTDIFEKFAKYFL